MGSFKFEGSENLSFMSFTTPSFLVYFNSMMKTAGKWRERTLLHKCDSKRQYFVSCLHGSTIYISSSQALFSFSQRLMSSLRIHLCTGVLWCISRTDTVFISGEVTTALCDLWFVCFIHISKAKGKKATMQPAQTAHILLSDWFFDNLGKMTYRTQWAIYDDDRAKQ